MVDTASKLILVPSEGDDLRARELAFLKSCLERPRGSAVVLSGRRGVGKARLAEELVRHASAIPGAAILEGRTPLAGARSFHAYAEIARQALAWAETAGMTEALVDPVYADLAIVLERPQAEDTAPSLDQKLRFFDGLRRLLDGISARARLVVVVHDLERADSDTLELTSYLIDELFGDPALDPGRDRAGLFLALVRDDALESARAAAFLEEVAESRSAKLLRLEGLDLEGLRRYVQSPRVLEKLLAASRGLPQEVDALIESLPTNVEELFERRLTHLDAPSRAALSALAISGRPASARTLAEVTELPLKTVAQALADLREARTLERRVASGEFHFSFARRSDLEVTARVLSASQRAELHGRWAATLARDPETGLALLAHHQLRSSAPERGVALALRAAEEHAVAGAFDAAISALEGARPWAAGELLLTLLARLAELAPLTGSPRAALDAVEEWKNALPLDQRGRAHHREAELRNASGDYDRALLAISEARRATPRSAVVELAAIEATASESFYHLGALAKASEAAQAGLALLDGLGPEAPARSRVELMNLLAKIALASDRRDAAITMFSETLRVATAAGLEREQARALVNLGHAQMRAGAMREAEANLVRGIERAEAGNDLAHLAFGSLNLGVVLHQRGELGRAIELYRDSKSLFRRLGNRTQVARALHNLANVYLLIGDLTRAEAHNQEALRLARAGGVERLVAVASVLDGLIAAERGDRDLAEGHLRDAMVVQAKLGIERPLETLVELAELQLRFGDVEASEATLREVEGAMSGVEAKPLLARVSLVEGRLRATRQDPQSLELLTRARDAMSQLGRPLFVFEAELALGRARSALGQREAARVHLTAARALLLGLERDLPEELRGHLAGTRASTELRATLAALDDPSATGAREPARARGASAIEAPPKASTPSAARRAEWTGKYGAIIGASPKLHRIFHILDRVSASDGTVLVVGESGTGKELIAEAIHRSSPRAKGPFVKLNCAALVESLLLSELFGHERGSFTGAHQRKIGRFEMAAGGTIFLDEIGDISPKTQVSLLRVLQEREFERVGGGRPIKVEARIVVATNKNLAQMVRDGEFREDLYYRLKGITIDMPSLRERPEDILGLARHFLGQYAAESGGTPKRLTRGAEALLLSYAWPGNVRELENIVRSVALFAESTEIDERDFDEYRELFQDGPSWSLSTAPNTSPRLALDPTVGLPPAEPTPLRAGRGPGTPERPRPPVEGREGREVGASRPPPQVSVVASGPPPNPESAGSPEDERLDADLLSQIFAQGVPLPELKRRLQEQAIARALRLTKGNITRAAEMLGMRRPRLSQIINASEQLKSLCQGGER